MAKLRSNRLGFIGTFALLSGAAITVLGLALAQIESVHDRADAMDHAAASAQLLAQVGLQPHIDRRDLENGLPPSAVAALDDAFEAGLADGRLTRIKLWSSSGQVSAAWKASLSALIMPATLSRCTENIQPRGWR